MTPDATENLPPSMRESLLAEIDPGETLRWCGQPCARRIARATLAAALFFALVLGLMLGGLPLVLGYSTRAELLGLDSPLRFGGDSGERPSWMTVWVALTIGWVVVAVCLVAPVLLTWSEVRAARRTVYALTDTRVFMLRVGRAGRAHVHSVEPGHPLSLSRRDLAGGRGDIQLHPSLGGSRGSLMRLIGIADAGRIERLIRSTFDPPVSDRTGRDAP